MSYVEALWLLPSNTVRITHEATLAVDRVFLFRAASNSIQSLREVTCDILPQRPLPWGRPAEDSKNPDFKIREGPTRS